MKVTVTKKGAGRKLAGSRRKQGEVLELEKRSARVFCAVGFTTLEIETPVKKKKTKKKASKKTKTVYSTRDMTAEK